MELRKTGFDDLFIIETFNNADARGRFTKLFNTLFFEENNLETNYEELYYSCSKKNVIRGMHFQIPPRDHVKVVFVSMGEILDVVLDLRKNSKTFGKYFSTNISGRDGSAIYIPKGFAHGFLSLENNTTVHYLQSTCHDKESDQGVNYNSFGFDWPVINPILSERDRCFVDFHKFNTPF